MDHLTIRSTVNSNLQNEMNVSIIFNYLRTSGAAYRAQISRALNISAPAVSRAVDLLVQKGYLIESGTIKTEQGKKTPKITINSDIGFIVAIDMVKERLQIAIADFSGEIRESRTSFKIGETPDLPNRLISEIKAVATSYREENGGALELKAISIGIPATTNLSTGVLTTVLYEDLERFDIKPLLERSFNVPVYLENIAKLSAVGESNCGEGKKCRNMIFLEISNGIGAGIIMNNNLVRGYSGYAGEIGYSLTQKGDLDSIKLRKGALECIASIESMVSELKRELSLGAESVLKSDRGAIGRLDAMMLFEAAGQRDALAMCVLDNAAKPLAMCIANLILTLDPEVIFIGGDICHLPGVEALFIEPISAYVAKVLPFKPPLIRLSSLGEKAGIIGAAFMAIETQLTGKYPYRIE